MRKLGGLKLTGTKEKSPIRPTDISVPKRIRVPLEDNEAAVKTGQRVRVGEIVGISDTDFSVPVHSGVSGTVTHITEEYVEIHSDGKQEKYPELTKVATLDRETLWRTVRGYGLVGMGGAGFPTHVKLRTKERIDTLIINGAECEPYVISDLSLMYFKPHMIARGARIIENALDIHRVVIGIEKRSTVCREKLEECGLEVKILDDAYPKGAERVLIYEVTGREVIEKTTPAQSSVIVLNAATCAQIGVSCLTGVPLVSRLVTVGGDFTENAMCLNVPIGTEVGELLSGINQKPALVLDGGVMMGREIGTDAVVRKTTGAVLAFKERLKPEEKACIRCGRCYRACPVGLSPAAFDRAYHAENIKLMQKLNIDLCMLCGCCEYVCPSKRNLTEYNKMCKKLVSEAKR